MENPKIILRKSTEQAKAVKKSKIQVLVHRIPDFGDVLGITTLKVLVHSRSEPGLTGAPVRPGWGILQKFISS